MLFRSRVAGAPGIYVRLADPGSHAALTGPAPGADPFAGLGTSPANTMRSRLVPGKAGLGSGMADSRAWV